MENQFLLFMIIVIIITFILWSNNDDISNNDNYYEPFDARVMNLTKEQCGKLCTSIIGCQGFAYDDQNRCYLSKTPILTKPTGSLFTDEYNVGDYRCNKSQPILDPTDLVSKDLMRRNALYMCSDDERGKYDFTAISENKITKIGDFYQLDKVDIPDYHIIKDFTWPNVKQDTNLTKGKDGIDKFMLYNKSNDEYIGSYLFDHKCSSNVNLTSCLQTCETAETCLGTEWNPYYVKNDGNTTTVYKNVCCPKTTITDIIPRRSEYENGNFYIKKHVDNFDKNKIYILTQDQTDSSKNINYSR